MSVEMEFGPDLTQVEPYEMVWQLWKEEGLRKSAMHGRDNA